VHPGASRAQLWKGRGGGEFNKSLGFNVTQIQKPICIHCKKKRKKKIPAAHNSLFTGYLLLSILILKNGNFVDGFS